MEDLALVEEEDAGRIAAAQRQLARLAEQRDELEELSEPQIFETTRRFGTILENVGFDLDSLPSSERTIAEDTLKSCGSSLEHFYNTLDAGELQTAFRDIGVKLSSIALTR